MRSLYSALAALGVICLACATTPYVPRVVVEGYRRYAQRDCPGVHRLLVESPDAEQQLQLLDAYCTELRGDIDAAQDRYRSIAAADPRAAAAREALFRLRDLESLARAGLTRAERKERAYAPGSPADRPEVRLIDATATPSYPAGVLAARVQGWILLEYAVRSDGTVTDAVMLDSEPPFVFDRAAIATVWQWTYEANARRETFRRKLRYELVSDRFGLTPVREGY